MQPLCSLARGPKTGPPLPEVNLLAVKIRLARHGAKKAPFYRVVVSDGRARRDGRFIEIVGRYNPRTTPSTVELDLEKVDAWIAKGAQPTEAAGKLIAIARGDKQVPEKTEVVSKKAAAKAAEEEAAAVKAAEDAVKAAEEAKAAAAAAAEEAKAAAEAPAEEAAPEADEASEESAPAAEDAAAAPESDEPADAEAEPAE
jgi:small subunit ribosomal protein S16